MGAVRITAVFKIDQVSGIRLGRRGRIAEGYVRMRKLNRIKSIFDPVISRARITRTNHKRGAWIEIEGRGPLIIKGDVSKGAIVEEFSV